METVVFWTATLQDAGMNGPTCGLWVLMVVCAGCSLVPPEPGVDVYLYRPLEGISPGEIVGLHSERSLSELSAALERDSDNPRLFEKRGWSYAQARKFKPALDDLTAAIRILDERDPPDESAAAIARLYTRRGLVFRAAGKSKKAEGDFTTAIERDPNNWEHYFHRWQIRRELGDADGAEQDRQMGLKLRKRHFEVQYSAEFGVI